MYGVQLPSEVTPCSHFCPGFVANCVGVNTSFLFVGVSPHPLRAGWDDAFVFVHDIVLCVFFFAFLLRCFAV